MPRSRNIKFGAYQNEKLGKLGPDALLLFIGLPCLADRRGRLEYRPDKIRAQLFPYRHEVSAKRLMNRLAKCKTEGHPDFLILYPEGSPSYIQIVNFEKHQNPHWKEPESELPPPPGYEDSPYCAEPVPEKLRQAIFQRDGKRCEICGATESLSIDHIIPRAQGGTSDPSNLQVLCTKCNSAKATTPSTKRQPCAKDESSKAPTSEIDPADSLSLVTDSLLPSPKEKTKKPCRPKTADPLVKGLQLYYLWRWNARVGHLPTQFAWGFSGKNLKVWLKQVDEKTVRAIIDAFFDSNNQYWEEAVWPWRLLNKNFDVLRKQGAAPKAKRYPLPPEPSEPKRPKRSKITPEELDALKERFGGAPTHMRTSTGADMSRAVPAPAEEESE